MKNILLLLIILSPAFKAASQTLLSGTVTGKNNKPLANVNISIRDSYDGAVTDTKGHYSFTAADTGKQVLVMAATEYDTLFLPVILEGRALVYNAQLKINSTAQTAVTVISRGFIAGDGKRGAVMTSQDIYTTGGANGDIGQAMRNLPGTQQLGEKEGLAVRGGDVYETKQFIDGTLLNRPFYTSANNIPSRTRYPPALFKDIAFSTGGYSALYGQALSSALVLETIDIPDKSEANANITPLFWGGGIQKVARDKKSSFGFDYAYTNVGLYFKLVKQTPDFFRMPQYHSADANFRIKTKGGGIVKYYGTFDYNQMGLRTQSVDSFALKNAFSLRSNNWYHNLSWKQPLANNWKLSLGLSYSSNIDKITQQLQDSLNQVYTPTIPSWDTLNFNLHRTDNMAQAKLVMEKKLTGMSALRFGGEYWHNDYKFTYNNRYLPLKDNYSAAFAETDIYLTDNIALQTGLRLENSPLLKTTNLAPRAALAYQLNKGNQLTAAYGIFYQKPENMYLVYNRDLDMTKASHYILTYLRTGKGTMLRTEIYYKKYQDLVKTWPGYNNQGNGDAKGLDIFWRDNNHTFRNFEYWISYSYIDTKRNYLNYPYSMQPNFIATHTASLVTKKYFSSISSGLSATYNFATGRPYYNLLLRTITDPAYTLTDQGKTKQYNMVNLSAYHLLKIGKGFGVLYASMSNLLNRNNVFGYSYSLNGMNKMPILPTAKRFYFIALFINWGVDRSQDVINNNL